MPKMLFDNIRGINRRYCKNLLCLALVLLLFFPLGFNKNRKASYYSRTSNLGRGLVVTSKTLKQPEQDYKVTRDPDSR